MYKISYALHDWHGNRFYMRKVLHDGVMMAAVSLDGRNFSVLSLPYGMTTVSVHIPYLMWYVTTEASRLS